MVAIIVEFLTSLIFPNTPRYGKPNISFGTLTTNKSKNKLNANKISCSSVLINKGMINGAIIYIPTIISKLIAIIDSTIILILPKAFIREKKG